MSSPWIAGVQGLSSQGVNRVTFLAYAGCLILAAVGLFLIGERVFRRIVTPQIADIFENVPPFNVTASVVL